MADVEDLNHYVRREAMDFGILTGKPARALCGVVFVPELRVGSSGGADNPELPTCPECERIYGGLEDDISATVNNESHLADAAPIHEPVLA